MARRDLPPNTYCRKGYYTWRNPRTRDEFGLGSNKTQAIQQAVEANIHIAKLSDKPRLIDRLTGNADRSVLAWSELYAKYLARLDRADNTRKAYASMNKRIVAMLGPDTSVKSVTALKVSEIIEQIAVTEGKARTAQAFRHFARDWFREAVVQGWRDDNPVRDTKLGVKVEVKRARLSLEVLRDVYSRSNAWLQNAIALALVGAQRREDVADAKFTDFRNGGWWLKQSSEKSAIPHQIFVPMDLRLEAWGMTLGEVVSQCRRTGVVSPYLVHQTRPYGNSPTGSPIFVDTITKRFTAHVLALGIDWGDRTPPTFHEIRSLSERLYRDQGGVNTQHLLGHTEPDTTDIYNNSRGSEWTHALDGRKIVSE